MHTPAKSETSFDQAVIAEAKFNPDQIIACPQAAPTVFNNKGQKVEGLMPVYMNA